MAFLVIGYLLTLFLMRYKILSLRQKFAEKLKVKVGEKIRLIWDARDPEKKPVIYLVRKGRRRQLSMPDCFGRLGDKVAADVCRWMTKEDVVTAARVVKIVGGTRKRPKLGCVLELSTYPAPKKKGIAKWLAKRGY